MPSLHAFLLLVGQCGWTRAGDHCDGRDATCSNSQPLVLGKLGVRTEALTGHSWREVWADTDMRLLTVEGFLSEHEANMLAKTHMDIVKGSPPPIICGSAATIRRLAPAARGEALIFGTDCLNTNASARHAAEILKHTTFSTAFYAGEEKFTEVFDRRVEKTFPSLRAQVGGRFQVTSHPEGTGYGMHHDCTNSSMTRAATVLIYLADVKGGETKFPELSKSVKPKTGRAVVWNSVDEDGTCMSRSLHSAGRVRKGRKFTLQRWYYTASAPGLGERHHEPFLPKRAQGVPKVSCDGGETEIGQGDRVPQCRWYDHWEASHLVAPVIRAGEQNTAMRRVDLSFGEVHIVDDFLSTSQTRALMRRARDIGFETSFAYDGMKRAVRSTRFLFVDENIANVLLAIVEYANTHLVPQQTVAEYRGFVVPHSAHYYKYVSLDKVLASSTAKSHGVNRSGAAPHTDTDHDGRCLSAVLHLHEPHQGGNFALHRCPLPNCQSLRGRKLAEAYETKSFDSAAKVEVVDTAAGRLVFFLAESIHSVQDVLKGTGEFLFLWMTCDPSDEWGKTTVPDGSTS